VGKEGKKEAGRGGGAEFADKIKCSREGFPSALVELIVPSNKRETGQGEGRSGQTRRLKKREGR